MRFIKRVGDRGTVTLPSDVREALGVGEGDIIEFEIVTIVRRTGQGPSEPRKGRAVPAAGEDPATSPSPSRSAPDPPDRAAPAA